VWQLLQAKAALRLLEGVFQRGVLQVPHHDRAGGLSLLGGIGIKGTA